MLGPAGLGRLVRDLFPLLRRYSLRPCLVSLPAKCNSGIVAFLGRGLWMFLGLWCDLFRLARRHGHSRGNTLLHVAESFRMFRLLTHSRFLEMM